MISMLRWKVAMKEWLRKGDSRDKEAVGVVKQDIVGVFRAKPPRSLHAG
jgi:hypothetical protein